MRHLLVLSLVLLMMSLFAVVALAQPLGAARVYSCAELKSDKQIMLSAGAMR